MARSKCNVINGSDPICYDDKGYLGTGISGGTEVLKVTPYDRIFFVRKSGIYTVCDVPQKLFVDSGMWYCNYADKDIINDTLFTIIYRDPKTQYAYIKRCRVASWIMNRDYMFAPNGMEVIHIDTRKNFKFTLHYIKKPRVTKLEEIFKTNDYQEKGLKAQGVRLTNKAVDKVTVEGSQKELF